MVKREHLVSPPSKGTLAQLEIGLRTIQPLLAPLCSSRGLAGVLWAIWALEVCATPTGQPDVLCVVSLCTQT